MENVTTVGVDLSKNLMHTVFMTSDGKIIKRKKYNTNSFADMIKELPQKATICAEACAGAHYFGRLLQSSNFKVKLIHPVYVIPFVQRNKNDYNDATAIAEAGCRKNIKNVPVKSECIQSVQALHTARSKMVSMRTQLINSMRGTLLEFGVRIPQTTSSFMRYINKHYNTDEKINHITRVAIDALIRVLSELEENITKIEKELSKISKNNSTTERLTTIPGIGCITATALFTVSGNPNVFKNGRNFSSNLGLTPRQNTTGDKPVLLGISKKGNTYVRQLLTLCARTLIIKANRTTALSTAKMPVYKSNDKMSLWIRKLLAKNIHSNKVCIAIANKLARISYRILIGNRTVFDANLSNGSNLM